MRENYIGVRITLGETEIYGEGWSFESALGLGSDFGRSVLKLVDHGAMIEDVGGENGSAQLVFSKDFATLEAALTTYGTLKVAVKEEGVAELSATWGSGPTEHVVTLAAASCVSSISMSVQPFYYGDDAVIRLTINYNVLTL